MRADAGLKILAMGGTLKKKECLLLLKWTIHKLSKNDANPEAAAIMAKAGTDKSSMEMIPLPNGKPGI